MNSRARLYKGERLEKEKMNKKKMSAFLAAVMIFSVLSGCGKKETKSGQNENVDHREKTELAFDNYGRKITVQGVPKKVLTFGPNCTELFCALGLEKYVIGDSLNNHSRGALPQYKETYDKIPELNHSSATRESVETSGADFIYGIDWEFGEEGLDVDELEQFGITTYMNSASTPDEMYQEIRDLGEIFCIEDKAEAYVKEQKTRIAAVKDQAANRKPVNVLVYDSGNDGIFTCGGNNFETLLIELAGGKNIFDDQTKKQWITVSYEEAIAREPDVILIHDYDSPSVKEKIDEIKNNAVLSQLECVKKERFATIELESVLPGDRMAYTIEKLAGDFHEFS